MDIKTLMIGDWVYNKHHGKNIKLTQYDFFTHTHNEFGEQELAPFTKPTFGHDLEPIPLTTEILEKNGLRKVILDGEHNSKQDYYIDTHFVGYYNMDKVARVHASPIVYDIKQKWLFVDDKKVCRIELWCPYVHQLQHALGLCGIEKEIEL